MRIGVCTGGGDAPGLNAVIRAVVKTAIRHYGWEVMGIRDGFSDLIELPEHPWLMTLDDVRGILPRGGTILGTSNRGDPFKVPVERGGKVVLEDHSDAVLENFKKLGLGALITIGGDGTMTVSLELLKRGIPVVGVPKTIDNDLLGTDITFGFTSAVKVATDAIDRLHTTAESHHRIMVVEVMGRHSGWIALEAGIAGGADIILIPEIPFKMHKVCEKLEERQHRGSKFSIVVVAEGARAIGGEVIYHRTPDGKKRLGGVGEWVAERITEDTGLETRVVVLGHLQRGGSPEPFDRILATRLGVYAVELIERAEFGKMVCLKGTRVEAVPLEEVIKDTKRVDPETDQLVRSAEMLGICLGR